jgi:hypothetical protein
MFTFNSNKSILDFCKELLKKRFPKNILKHDINTESDSDKLNFACPFCGDSKKDGTKKRGNLYLKTETYKCYNDGCGIFIRLTEFVSTLGLKYKIDIPNVNTQPVFELAARPTKKGFLFEFLINHDSKKELLCFSKVIDRFSLIPCKDAPINTKIYNFINNRCLFDINMFKKTCYYDSREDKIYIFNLDLNSNKVIGFSLRYINPSKTGLRYNIKNYSEFKKTGLIKKMDSEFIIKINSLNNYFNILNLDFSKDIIIVEGQFDSMFINNCVATTGISKSKYLLNELTTKDKTKILFDNDVAGIYETLKLLKKGYRVFLWSKVILELKKKHKKKIKAIKEIKDINDLYKFMKLQNSNLNYTTFNKFIDCFFSNSIFDTHFV